MNSPWTVIATGAGLDATWKCEECGRIVFKAGEPSQHAHLHHCSHSPHRDDSEQNSAVTEEPKA